MCEGVRRRPTTAGPDTTAIGCAWDPCPTMACSLCWPARPLPHRFACGGLHPTLPHLRLAPQWRAFLSFLDRAAHVNASLILSAEGFDGPTIKADMIADAMQAFDTTVVVAYRRYHEWIKRWTLPSPPPPAAAAARAPRPAASQPL